MKSNKILFGLCAALALAGCEKQSPNTPPVSGETHYLAVNIVAAPDVPGMKAAPGGATYENGTTEENAVKKVRFYFFTDDGNIANVKAVSGSTSMVNFLDWETPATVAATGRVDVEKMLSATLVINTAEGDGIPNKVLAVINPDNILSDLGSTSKSLEEIRNIFADFASQVSTSEKITANGFIMANSVYANSSGSRVSTTQIQASNMCESEDDAKANPVIMYVERNVAKVALSYGTGVTVDATKGIALKSASGDALTYKDGDNDKQAYLKVTGWNLTATTEKAFLSKHINAQWKSDLFGGSISWNYYPYSRSFWAHNVLANNDSGDDVAGSKYLTYNEIGTKSIGTTAGKYDSYFYTNENAATKHDNTGEQRTYPTQVIIAGTLMQEDGTTPLELANYRGTKYVGKDALITAMLPYISLYKKTTDGSSTTYTHIEAGDVELVSKTSVSGQGQGKQYAVTLKFKDTDQKWCLSEGGEELEPANTDVINRLQAEEAMIYKDGLTYYSFKVKHLAENNAGMYGVVRNHFYQIAIDAVYGFGTPVFDPTVKIYPETPVEEDTYIAAKVNILSWRVVPSSVNLGE